MDIKELERLLDLKKAYASVQVGFGKGSKFPQDIKNEVQKNIKEFCLKLSSQVDNSEQSDDKFTEQEVAVLKELASAVMKKNSKSPVVSDKAQFNSIADVAKAAQGENKPLTAMLLTTENIPKERRKLIDSNETVTIVKLSDEEAVIMNNKKERFVVPVEDLEVNQQ